ncbi:uncharacterized protein LOC113373049 [Ctenocephalides felis]|nr:uncharacterized protein LOC113373049 [Ctenocephalides felis]
MEWFSRSGLTMAAFIDSLHDIINVEQDFIHSCWERINRLVLEWTASQTQNTSPSATSSQSISVSAGAPRNSIGSASDSASFDGQKTRVSDISDRNTFSNQQKSESKSGSRNQTTSVTPTDVRDVHF